MSVGIETEDKLKEALQELVRGEEKEVLFNGGYKKDSDARLYEGLVKAGEAARIESRVTRDQEMLKWLLSVEGGCKERLKAEYWQKLEGCVGFLQRTLGTIYVEILTGRGGGGDVAQLLQELSGLVGSAGVGGRTSVESLLFQLQELS